MKKKRIGFVAAARKERRWTHHLAYNEMVIMKQTHHRTPDKPTITNLIPLGLVQVSGGFGDSV
jgi:hypothetical protein